MGCHQFDPTSRLQFYAEYRMTPTMVMKVILALLFRLQFPPIMELLKELVSLLLLFYLPFYLHVLFSTRKKADYYQKRTKHEIQGILNVAKVAISAEAFDRAWETVQGKFSSCSLKLGLFQTKTARPHWFRSTLNCRNN